MKIIILLTAIFAGCAGVFSIERTPPSTMYIESLDESGLHRIASWGNYIKYFQDGDSVIVIGHQGDYYYAVAGSDTGFVEKADLISSREFQVKKIPLVFKLPMSESDDAWGRANLYLSNNSSMKVQTASDYLLETYNPTSVGRIGFSITRSPVKDSVLFTVKSVPFGSTEREIRMADREARYLAQAIMKP
jgi:hypothetical protein